YCRQRRQRIESIEQKMWIHARLQGARLGQSHCPCLLIAVTYLLNDSQNQRRAQTLQHRSRSNLLDPLRCRGRTRSEEEDQAIPQQRYPKSQTESRQRVARQLRAPSVQQPSDQTTAHHGSCDGAQRQAVDSDG